MTNLSLLQLIPLVYYVSVGYEMLPRYKKKNLVKVYLIHSLMVTKTFLTLSNPFKSSKTLDKVEVFDTLSDVLQKLELNKKNMLRNFPYVVQRAEELNLGIQRPISPFGTDLWILSARLGNKFKEFHHIPTVLSFVLQYLESKEYVITQNLLHLQLESNKLYDLVSKVEDMGENYEFLSVEEVVVVFRLILGTQRCGLFGPETHTKFTAIVVNQGTFEEAQEELRKQVKQLRSEMFECILCIIKTLRVVVRNSSRNGMNLKLVSKAMAPFFFRPMKPDVYIYKLLPVRYGACTQSLVIYYRVSHPNGTPFAPQSLVPHIYTSYLFTHPHYLLICNLLMYEGLLSSMIEKPGLYFDKEPQAKLVNKEPTESTSVNTRETSRERERSKERKEKEHSRSKREDNSKDNKSREHNSRDETSRDRSREDSKDNRLREDSKERRERGSRLVEDKSPRNDSITLSD
eukprot:XP_763115.1 hypothetical protein [Theileria parva strain Muguga]